MATYYVSTTGSNANNGTSSTTPFLTIAKAHSVAVAGDVIRLLPGRWTEDVTFTRGGNSTTRITLMSDDAANRASWRGKMWWRGDGANAGDYWQVTNLNIIGIPATQAVPVSSNTADVTPVINADHVKFSGCDFTNRDPAIGSGSTGYIAPGSGSFNIMNNIGSGGFGGGVDIEYDHCTFHEIGDWASRSNSSPGTPDASGFFEHAVYSNQSNGLSVHDCVFWRVAGRGVQLYSDANTGPTVQSNVFDECGTGVIVDGNSTTVTVTKNIFTNVDVLASVYKGSSFTGSGVTVSDNWFNTNTANVVGFTNTLPHTGDPLYTNRAARNYTLTAASPAHGYGPDTIQTVAVIVNPGDNFATAVTNAPAGTAAAPSVVTVNQGTYRITQTAQPKAFVKIRAAAGASPTVVASKLLHASTDGTLGAGWTAGTGVWTWAGSFTGPTGANISGTTLQYDQSNWNETVFIAGRACWIVGLKTGGVVHGSAVGAVSTEVPPTGATNYAGNAYLDFDAHTVTINVNPTSKQIELSQLPGGVINSSATGVEVTGLNVWYTTGNCVDAQGTNWLVQDCDIRGGEIGVHVSDGCVVKRNVITYNSHYGLNGPGATGTGGGVVIGGRDASETADGNEISFNDHKQLRKLSGTLGTPWASGATKFTDTDQIKVFYNHIHHNWTTGLWLDIDNTEAEVAYNTVDHNGLGNTPASNQIWYEVSYGRVAGSPLANDLTRPAKFHHNTIDGGGFSNTCGIFISTSQNCDVSQNDVTNCGDGSVLIVDSLTRGQLAKSGWPVHRGINNTVHDNPRLEATTSHSGVQTTHSPNPTSPPDTKPFTTNTFQRNAWLGSTPGSAPTGTPYSWQSGTTTSDVAVSWTTWHGVFPTETIWTASTGGATNVRDTNKAGTGAGVALSVNLSPPPLTQVGDLLLVGFHVNDDTNPQQTPAGYTVVAAPATSTVTGGNSLAVYRKFATSADLTASIPLAISGAATRRILGVVLAIPSVASVVTDVAPPALTTTGSTNTNTAITAPSVTTTTTNVLLVDFVAERMGGSAQTTPPALSSNATGVTVEDQVGTSVASGSNTALAAGTKQIPTAGATGTRAYQTDGAGNLVAHTIPLRVSVVSAPVNTNPPLISAQTQEGQTITATQGQWQNNPTSFAYQWQRNTGSGFTNISAATAQTYTLVTADVGAVVRVQETATNTAGSATANSAQSGTITATPVLATAPTVTAPTAGATLTGRVVTFTWTAPATGTTPFTYEVSPNTGVSFTSVGSALSYTNTYANDGTFTFQVRALNTAGTGPAASRTFTVATPVTPPAAPAVSATAGGVGIATGGSTTSTRIDFTFSVANATSYTESLDGAAATTATSPRTFTVATGTHTYAVTASNAGGSSPTTTFTWTVLPPPPTTVTITATSGGNPLSTGTNTSATDATFTFSAGGATSYQSSLDGAAFATHTSPQSFSGFALGAHTFQARGVNAGGTGPTQSFQWTVVTDPPPPPPPPSAPTVTATAGPDALPNGGSTTQTSAVFTFSSSSATSYQSSLDSAAFATATSPLTVTPGVGAHTLRIAAVNAQGTSPPAVFSWTVIDPNPPVAYIADDDGQRIGPPNRKGSVTGRILRWP